MSVKVTTYKGFHLGGAALEVSATSRFLSCLTMLKVGGTLQDDAKVLTTHSHYEDGLFTTADEAIDAALAFGQEVVNGEIRP